MLLIDKNIQYTIELNWNLVYNTKNILLFYYILFERLIMFLKQHH